MFDATISLGTVLQTVTIIGSALIFIWKLHTKLEIMDTKQTAVVAKIDTIEKELEKLTTVTIEQAKQTQRLDNFESRLQEISNRIFDHVNAVLEKNNKMRKTRA